MAVAFSPGQTLGRGDLDIFLTNSNGAASNAYEISFALYYVDPDDGSEVLIGSNERVALNPVVGEYYASLMTPPSATPGTYRIRWTFKEFANTPSQQVVQEFAVVESSSLVAATYSDAQQDMINKLRLLLRDQNPDKFYHFRPPAHEGTIGQFDKIFGQIWEDVELLEYLERSLDWWNMMPPETESLRNLDTLYRVKPVWRTAILWGAISHAALALMANWIADEFDYSIGGISLSVERSAKYETLKVSADGQFDKAVEAKARTTKFIRGLKQYKYGIGVRSAFGPHVGAGVLSPRNFI